MASWQTQELEDPLCGREDGDVPDQGLLATNDGGSSRAIIFNIIG